MAKTKKILDVNTGSAHLICIQSLDRSDWNPYRVYLVTFVPGAGNRKRLLIKYGDLVSVLCFIKDFYLDGIDTRTAQDILTWAKKTRIV